MKDITIYIALYGAILATLVFIWDIIKTIKDIPKIIIKANIHFLVGLKTNIRKKGITVINRSRRPVTIVATGFRIITKSNDNMATILDTKLPIELTEGKSHTSFLDSNEISGNKIYYAWARSATGKLYISKKHPFKNVN